MTKGIIIVIPCGCWAAIYMCKIVSDAFVTSEGDVYSLVDVKGSFFWDFSSE